jgi:hypothetical protein
VPNFVGFALVVTGASDAKRGDARVGEGRNFIARSEFARRLDRKDVADWPAARLSADLGWLEVFLDRADALAKPRYYARVRHDAKNKQDST